MKKILLLALFFPIFCICQNPGFELLKKVNGIEVYYKKTLKKSTTKKDIWLFEIEYTNTTDQDIYYKAFIKEATKWENAIEYKSFAYINTENTKGMFNTVTIDLCGDKTRLYTDVGENIYIIKKGKNFTKNIEFIVEKNITPVLSLTSVTSISFTTNLLEFL